LPDNYNAHASPASAATAAPGAAARSCDDPEPNRETDSAWTLCLLDADGHIESWSAGVKPVTGYEGQDLAGRHFSLFYLPDDIAANRPGRALQAASGKGRHEEAVSLARGNGTVFQAQISFAALRQASGAAGGFAMLIRDSGERPTPPNPGPALQDSQAKYHALYQHSNDAILLTRPDGAILSANPAACRLFGYSEAELCALGRGGLVDASDPALPAALAERERRGEVAAELTFVRRGGERLKVRVASKIFTDATGARLTSMIIHDVTERRKMEEALRQSEERFRMLYEHAPLGIAHFDQDRCLTYANRKFAEMVGYAPEELIGVHYLDMTPLEARAHSIELSEKLFSGQLDLVNRERPVLCKDGSIVSLRVTAGIVRDDAGQAQYAIVTFEDTRARQKAEAALQRSEEKLRATL